MSIADDIDAVSAQLNTLVPKEDGNLIRSNDWNTLVAQILQMGLAIKSQQSVIEQNTSDITSLQSDVGGLQSSVNDIVDLIGSDGDSDTIIDRLNSLENTKLDKTEFNTFKSKLDPLLLQYNVTLETDSLDYALGDSAIITANVTQLNGDPVNSRPWLDFIVSWGLISAVSGYTARPGAGGRSVSVQCDANGVAKIRIKAENIIDTSDHDDDEVQAFFETKVQYQSQEKTVRELIFETDTSSDPTADTFYLEYTDAYSGKANNALRMITDDYYQKSRVTGREWRFKPAAGRWNYYRSTIAVFAKDDAVSTTADAGKGVSSLQINFKDWIGPWLDDYLDHDWYGDLFDDLPPIFTPPMDPIDPPWNPYDDLVLYFDERMEDMGILERGKFLEEVGGLAKGFNETTYPRANVELMESVSEAALAQKDLDAIQFSARAGQETQAGMAVLKGMMLQGVNTYAVGDKVGRVNGQIEQLDGKISNVDSKYSGIEQNLNGKISELGNSMDSQLEGFRAESGGKFDKFEGDILSLNSKLNDTSVLGSNIQQMLGSIDNKVTGINVLDNDSVQSSIARITADIGLIKTDLNSFNR